MTSQDNELHMAYRYGQHRNQMMLLPQSIDQYVPDDHSVRAYDAFVNTLDFKQLGISINTRKVGNSQYDPRTCLLYTSDAADDLVSV